MSQRLYSVERHTKEKNAKRRTVASWIVLAANPDAARKRVLRAKEAVAIVLLPGEMEIGWTVNELDGIQYTGLNYVDPTHIIKGAHWFPSTMRG